MASIWRLGVWVVGCMLGGCEQLTTLVEGEPEGQLVPVKLSQREELPRRLGGALHALRPPPAISGGTLTVGRDGTYAVASDSDRDALFIVKLADESLVRVTFEVGAEPGRVALDESGSAHVVLRGLEKVVQVDLARGTILRERRVCAFPRGVAYRSATDSVWVACADGELVVLAGRSYEEQTRKFVERDLRDVVFDRRGELYVSRYRSAEILHLSQQGEILRRFELSPSPRALLQDGPDQDVRITRMTPALAWRMATDEHGDVVVLHQRSQEGEISLGRPQAYGEGPCSAVTQSTISRIDVEGTQAVGAALAHTVLGVDVAVSPGGEWMAVAAPGNYLRGAVGGVQIYKAAVVEPELMLRQDGGVGQLEHGVGRQRLADGGVLVIDPSALCPPCEPAVDSELTESQVVAVAFAPDGRLLVQSREPSQIDVYALRRSGGGAQPKDLSLTSPKLIEHKASIRLDQSSARDSGHDLFHANVGGGIACASCHGEATDDAHVWSFEGIGPRRTQSMRGGLVGTAPFHWEGDLPTFQHLVDEVMTRRMGGFRIPAEHTRALAHWIDHQPAFTPNLPKSAAAERGRALFESESVGCAGCHAGPLFTNHQSADVGTGGRFQVPSLLGIALRAPYMHDGCAATMLERFEPSCGGGDRHGKTSHLSAAERADLVHYLETL